MVTERMKNRVVQTAVCGLVLAGLAMGASMREVSGTSGMFPAGEALTAIARPLRIVPRIVSVSEGYGETAHALAPRRYGSTMEEFFRTLEWYVDTYSDEGIDVAASVRSLLDNQGELYFGRYQEEEIKVFGDTVYDDVMRNRYWKYSFYLPDQTQPQAYIYIYQGDGYIYGCNESHFWSDDPLAVQMPEFHSCVEEGRLRILAYLDAVDPDTKCDIVYKNLERKDELEQYMQALHYSVSEEYADGRTATWEVYVDWDLSWYEDYFYVKRERNSYEKKQLCTWESPDGNFYTAVFSKSFQLEEDGSWRCGKDWKVVLLKQGETKESYTFQLDTEDCDWHGQMQINDYNFDGIPDIANIWGSPANWGGRSTTIYVWDEGETYHDAGTFVDVPGKNEDRQILYVSSRGGFGDYTHAAYQYRDGSFVCIGSLNENIMEDDFVIYTVRDEMGNEEVYRDELPEKWKELWW